MIEVAYVTKDKQNQRCSVRLEATASGVRVALVFSGTESWIVVPWTDWARLVALVAQQRRRNGR